MENLLCEHLVELSANPGYTALSLTLLPCFFKIVIPLIGYFETPSSVCLILKTASTTNFEKNSSFLFFV